LLLAALLAVVAMGQTASEVATIHPSQPGATDRPPLFQIDGTEFTMVDASPGDLIRFAYGVKPSQITGGPDWLQSDKYDVVSRRKEKGEPNPSPELRVRNLLADRFQLAFHRDRKELSVWAITVAKNGPKIRKTRLKKYERNGDFPRLSFRGPGELPGKNATLAEFAAMLQMVLDRPVVDRTRLSGKYDFDLTWSQDPKTPPDLFTAVEDQLGLKLQASSAPVEVLVVDRLEKPSLD
jgi:uncharacterized protein (TIGR03435 family)